MEIARELKAKGIAQTPYSPYWIKYAFLMWHQFAAEAASDGGELAVRRERQAELRDTRPSRAH